MCGIMHLMNKAACLPKLKIIRRMALSMLRRRQARSLRKFSRKFWAATATREAHEGPVLVSLFIFSFFVLGTILFGTAVYANSHIVRFTFTTPPQDIAVGAVSEQITIEAQDVSGSAVNGHTVCIHIVSSSPTGEFSTNAENWSAEPVRTLVLTLSSNQYRRNLYYKDSTDGAPPRPPPTLTKRVPADAPPPPPGQPPWGPETRALPKWAEGGLARSVCES